jgi:hypothetical protein
MSFRGYVSAKRRVHLQLPSDLERELRAVGQELGIGLGPAIRVVVGRGLDRDEHQRPCRDCNAAVAALIAAEHSLLVVASILPQGKSLIASLCAEAGAAAEQRLALIEAAGPEGEVTP